MSWAFGNGKSEGMLEVSKPGYHHPLLPRRSNDAEQNPGSVPQKFDPPPQRIQRTRQPSRLASAAYLMAAWTEPQCSPSLHNLPNRRLELYIRAFSSYDLRYSVGRSRKLDHDGAG